MITAKAWTGHKNESRVSRSHPAPLETRKEWKKLLMVGETDSHPRVLGSPNLRLVLR